MSQFKLPCVLAIAGTDPTGGAGVQADIKSISATGGYAASVVTALVAQNTQGVQSIHSIPCDFISEQIASVCTDLDILAVKIGMLSCQDVIEAVALSLEKFALPLIVIDPVMIAKSGCALLDFSAVNYLQKRLFPLAHLITPNLFETSKLLGREVITLGHMKEAARELSDKFDTNALVKGGHLDGNECCDVLCAQGEFHIFTAPRIHTQNTHGTGCTLSSAIATYLAQGSELKTAISLAKHYLSGAIKAGKDLKIGKGAGPVHHFYKFEHSPR